MKSKISFFNKTVFFKNVTLYWPLWSVYTLILLVMQPFVLWINYIDMLHFGDLTDERKLSYFLDSLTLQPCTVIIWGMAIVTGMAVYSYLYNAKSANMIHSLPVDRTQLFGTNLISGWAFLAVPQVLTFFITMLICLNYGVTHVEYLALWLLVCFGIDFIAFGLVTFCAFFTGQLITMPIYVIIVNSLVFMFWGIVELMLNFFAYGVGYTTTLDYDIVKIFSPFLKLVEDVSLETVYRDMEPEDYNVVVDGLSLEGGWWILIYVLVAVGLYVAAHMVYRKRHIEAAGDLITVNWVKPIFRWGVGICGAFYGTICIALIFSDIGITMGVLAFLMLCVILGVICYFVADMFVQKSFKVFKKKNWKQCGIFCGGLLASFALLFGYAKYMENYVPDVDDVKTANVYIVYGTNLKGESVQKAIDIHEEILSYKDIFDNSEYWNTQRISISYTMKNGTYVYRAYDIPVDIYEGDMFEKVMEMELDADNFLSNQICENYKDITEFEEGYVSYYDENYEYDKNLYNGDVAKEIFAAIIKDAQAGNLQWANIEPYRYEPYYQEYYEEYFNGVIESSTSTIGGEYVEVTEDVYYEETKADLCLVYYLPDDIAKKIISESEGDEGYYGFYYYDEELDMGWDCTIKDNRVTSEIYISFDKNCENIINALIENEVIESADAIMWEWEYK